MSVKTQMCAGGGPTPNASTSSVAMNVFANRGISPTEDGVTLSRTAQATLVTAARGVPSWKKVTPAIVTMVSCWTQMMEKHVWTLMSVTPDNMTARGCSSASIALVALTVSVHLATSEMDSPASTLMNVRQEITSAQVSLRFMSEDTRWVDVAVQEVSAPQIEVLVPNNKLWPQCPSSTVRLMTADWLLSRQGPL